MRSNKDTRNILGLGMKSGSLNAGPYFIPTLIMHMKFLLETIEQAVFAIKTSCVCLAQCCLLSKDFEGNLQLQFSESINQSLISDRNIDRSIV